MNISDIICIVIFALAFVAAIISMAKGKGRCCGKKGECGGCCENCNRSCEKKN